MLVAGGAFGQQPGGAPTAGLAKNESSTGVGKIGVGTIGPPTLPADVRIKLEDAAAAGLTASGAQVVSAAELSRARATAALGTCSDPVCERRLAEITDTRYWLRGTCQLDTSTYRLHLELVDARSGAVAAARDDTCDICTEADAADLTNVAASSLKATLTHSQTQQVTAAPPLPSISHTANSDKPSDQGAGRDGPEGSAMRRALPWMFFAGAAAAVGVGAYALSIDGDCVDMKQGICKGWYQTTWRLAVPLFAVGSALTTTGIILLGSPPAPTIPGTIASSSATSRAAAAPTQIIISPSGIAIAGRF